jgi:8-oxo-dGTP pyrophosphatase MutT (NUDIX family)
MKKNEAINPWQTISSEEKYDNKWIRIIENKVLNPAGNEGIYGVVHLKNIAVAIVPLDAEYNTWIVGQYRYALNSYEWEVPEGGCPEGTLPLDTAKRELHEEVGLEATHYDMILEMQLSNSTTDEISYSFVAKGLSYIGELPEEDEQITIKKLPFVDVYEMAMSGEIRDALSVATILKVKCLIDQGKI